MSNTLLQESFLQQLPLQDQPTVTIASPEDVLILPSGQLESPILAVSPTSPINITEAAVIPRSLHSSPILTVRSVSAYESDHQYQASNVSPPCKRSRKEHQTSHHQYHGADTMRPVTPPGSFTPRERYRRHRRSQRVRLYEPPEYNDPSRESSCYRAYLNPSAELELHPGRRHCHRHYWFPLFQIIHIAQIQATVPWGLPIPIIIRWWLHFICLSMET